MSQSSGTSKETNLFSRFLGLELAIILLEIKMSVAHPSYFRVPREKLV